MCGILGWDINRVLEVPQPYGGISRILADDDGGFRGFYEQTGVKPLLYPDHGICRRLSDRYSVPEHIRLHEAAVARLAHQWAVRLKRLGYDIDPELLRTAGLLHDIARLKPDHARAGARILRMEGYPVMAGIIQCHHRLEGGEESGLTERTLLFLADKMTLEDRMVDIDERFRQSAPKCTTPRPGRTIDFNIIRLRQSGIVWNRPWEAWRRQMPSEPVPRHLWTGRRGYGNGLPAEHKEMKSHGRK